jgi:ATP-dependent RNA helicase RhlE
MSFSAFGFCEPLLRAIDASGYLAPTPIQLKAIPAILAGRDVMAAAQTGSGKTASFTLPLLQRLAQGPPVKANQIRALVLTPTRELAVQVEQAVAAYGKHLALKSAVVYGGVKINPQMMKLRGGVDLLVATPGRLLDLYDRNALRFAQVETLVLDEADRMLDLGFSGELLRILALLPKKRQSLLFSATFSEPIRTLAGGLLDNPLTIDISPRQLAATGVTQWVCEVDKGKKPALLSHLLRTQGREQALVFVRTRNGAERLVRQLAHDGVCAAALHGDKSQGERSRALADFKASRVRVLVATDVAARGIDIGGLPRVINFDLPKVAEEYVHRIGRTGRAGLAGEAISLVSADEVTLLAAIESLIRQTLVREVKSGFIPSHKVPLTRQLKARPKKPKKPKKPAERDRGRNAAGEQKKTGHKPRRGGTAPDRDAAKETAGGRGGRGKNATAAGAGAKPRRRGPQRRS